MEMGIGIRIGIGIGIVLPIGAKAAAPRRTATRLEESNDEMFLARAIVALFPYYTIIEVTILPLSTIAVGEPPLGRLRGPRLPKIARQRKAGNRKPTTSPPRNPKRNPKRNPNRIGLTNHSPRVRRVLPRALLLSCPRRPRLPTRTHPEIPVFGRISQPGTIQRDARSVARARRALIPIGKRTPKGHPNYPTKTIVLLPGNHPIVRDARDVVDDGPRRESTNRRWGTNTLLQVPTEQTFQRLPPNSVMQNLPRLRAFCLELLRVGIKQEDTATKNPQLPSEACMAALPPAHPESRSLTRILPHCCHYQRHPRHFRHRLIVRFTVNVTAKNASMSLYTGKPKSVRLRFAIEIAIEIRNHKNRRWFEISFRTAETRYNARPRRGKESTILFPRRRGFLSIASQIHRASGKGNRDHR